MSTTKSKLKSSPSKRLLFPNVSKKKIVHSDPVGIKPVDTRVNRHGSASIIENQDKNKIFNRYGHVAMFSIIPGQELFSEPLTMVVDGFETSKMVCDLYRQHIDEHNMYGQSLPMMLLDLFCQDSFGDKHFGITSSSLIALKTPSSRMAKDTKLNKKSLYRYGLFLSSSLMRHSCNPNVEITLNERKDGVTVRALRHIPRGSELTRDMIAHHYDNLNSQSDHRKKIDIFSTQEVANSDINTLMGGLSQPGIICTNNYMDVHVHVSGVCSAQTFYSGKVMILCENR